MHRCVPGCGMVVACSTSLFQLFAFFPFISYTFYSFSQCVSSCCCALCCCFFFNAKPLPWSVEAEIAPLAPAQHDSCSPQHKFLCCCCCTFRLVVCNCTTRLIGTNSTGSRLELPRDSMTRWWGNEVASLADKSLVISANLCLCVCVKLCMALVIQSK